MPLAKEVAAELRKLADSLDCNGDAELIQPTIFFIHSGESSKAPFLALARLLPRPIVKGENYSKEKIKLEYESAGLDIYVTIPKSLTCELVESAKPAVYRCDPILSAEEDAELEVA